MRLHAITVRHYRRHKELRVELDPARNLIGGPNESGKSTLVEATHRALFLKAKGNSEIHRQMTSQTHGGKPEVEVEFEAEGKRYTLVKSFKGTSGATRLTQTQGATLQGDEAEEKLATLLKTGGPIKASEFNSQWAHLWVWQGNSSDDPLKNIGREHDQLVHQLQAHGGAAMIQSALDSKVADNFATQAEALFKNNGEARAGSDYANALLAEAQALNAETEAQAQLDKLQQAIHEHESATQQMAEAETVLKQQESLRIALAQRAADIARLKAQEQEHQRQQTEAQRHYQNRQDAEQKVSLIRQSLTQLQSKFTPLQEEQTKHEQKVLAERENLSLAEANLNEAGQVFNISRAFHELTQAQKNLGEKKQQHEQIKQRSEKIQSLRNQLAKADQQLVSLPKIDTQVLKQLQALEHAHDKATAILQNIATEIEVLAAETPVLANDKTLAAGQRLTLIQETELTIGKTLLRIHPGGGKGLADARQMELTAQTQFIEALTKIGISNLNEASTIVAKREQLQTDRKTLSAELKGLAAENIQEDLSIAERDLIAAQSEVTRRTHAELSAATALPIREAEAKQDTCLKLRTQANTQLQKAEAARNDHATSMRETLGQIAEQEVRLKVFLEHEGDEATRTVALQMARENLAIHEAHLNQTQQQLQHLQPQHLETDQARFDRVWQTQNDKKKTAHEKRISAAALLRNDGSSDPVTALALAKARTQSAQAKREAAGHHARAVQRIHALIQEEQQSLADQFTRPLVERVSGYLQRLFGPEAKAQITFQNGQFESLDLSRGQEAAFSFETLSNGAREQVAAAFRLATAEILAESHGGSLPIVFDDAFAHSDPDRVQKLQSMLDLAAHRGLQVILLTCTPNDYALMGAHEIRL